MRPLNRIGAQIDKQLTDTCRVERQTSAQDAMGAHRHEWALVADGVACRLISGKDSRTAHTVFIGEQADAKESYRVVLPLGTDVLGGDRIVINDIDYRVVALSRFTGLYIQAVVVT